ncbi:hypothetical protein BUALT_Bualt03G0197600 [Buddleja alternifolia]|uniref:F-box/LRR-repeat protein n=1 Tax=Buddleja alternifolia TaxID=168488 RepID=A0AAV6Y1S2_9LAMI|nr:hypothetical protein BUALT_Bualt03G0197600 [Buddleja alternifolia]
MDIRNDEGTETCRSMKNLKTYDANKDFISDLPDAILVHILSFLPINDVIQTVLLRRFANLWRHVPVLDLNSCLYHDCEDEDNCPDHLNEKFVAIIHHVMKLHERASLDKLRLKFCFKLSCPVHESFVGKLDSHSLNLLRWENSTADQIGKLIGYSISKKVQVLDINLKGCCNDLLRKNYSLPNVFISNHLIDLRLTCCDISGCRNINLKSLRVLLLEKISLSDEIMAEVLVSCPLLEDLSLVDCYRLRKLVCENPNLKKVLLILEKDEYLIISCPYVLSLEIHGCIECASLLDISSTVDVSILFSYSFRCEQREYDDVRKLLEMVSQCKNLSLCTWSVLVLTIWSFKNMPCPSFEWKNLTLELSLKKWHQPGLSLLLRKSHSLETLTMYIYPGSADILLLRESEWIQAYDFDGEKYWDSQEASFPYLESIMIYGYIDKPYVIQMVKFLLRSAKKLQKLVISTKESFETDHESPSFDGPIERQRAHFTPEQLIELAQKFKELPRASPEAVIYFS